MAHNHMLTNTNGAFAPNTERLKSQLADVVLCRFPTPHMAQHATPSRRDTFSFLFFPKSSFYWTGTKETLFAYCVKDSIS